MSQLPLDMVSHSPLPDQIHGYVSVQSQGQKSSFRLKKLPKSTEAFRAKKEDRREAGKNLESIGFALAADSALGFAVTGPVGAYEELTGGQLVTSEKLVYAEGARQRYVTHIDIVGRRQPRTLGCGAIRSKKSRLEGVLVERPRQLAGVALSPLPPAVPRFHLRVPDDVAVGMGAWSVQQSGQRGEGIKVAMVDSGQFNHPFFAAHGYRVEQPITVVPGTSFGEDPVGHGTGESANIFAVAPAAELHAVRASNNAGKLVGAVAGFLKAKSLNPHILTNSWGGDLPFPPPPQFIDESDITWALEILDAVQSGILVVFAAGNGSFSWEAQIPGVMSAGGVFMENDLDLRASDYASGYESPFFTNRIVPDACGLVGMRPRAAYIMLPVPPDSIIDREESLPAQGVPGDGTTATDGWALFSGTSAAAPQIAGVAALILGAKPGLTPAQVIQAMNKTAIDVRNGHCHPRFNNPAHLDQDQATGFGLVNAKEAVRFATENF